FSLFPSISSSIWVLRAVPSDSPNSVECKGLIISEKGVLNGDSKETVERLKVLILRKLYFTGILRGHTENDESEGGEWGWWSNS
ncbi:MAG: hypothetical protein II660_00785, partial [Bacteroidales bacterium]|nr:hypothetical protein [Bacteroidales bacterium]